MAARTGSKHHNAKLTPAKVRQARKTWAEGSGKKNIKQLAEKYGVANQTMWAALHRKTWVHVS